MATCSDGDSFYLDADYTYDGLSTYDGCYSDYGYTNSRDIITAYHRVDGNLDGEPIVVATNNFGTTVSKNVGNVNSRLLLLFIVYQVVNYTYILQIFCQKLNNRLSLNNEQQEIVVTG